MVETEKKAIDETVPGGKYITGDRYTNANGEDLGPVAKADLKADNAVAETEAADPGATKKTTK